MRPAGLICRPAIDQHGSCAMTKEQAIPLENYRDFHRAMRRRANSLGITRQRIDEIWGVATGFTSHVLAPQPVKKVGFDRAVKLAQALGCAVLIVENDPAAMQRIANDIGRKQRKYDSSRRRRATPRAVQDAVPRF
jgi:hypothetical protein